MRRHGASVGGDDLIAGDRVRNRGQHQMPVESPAPADLVPPVAIGVAVAHDGAGHIEYDPARVLDHRRGHLTEVAACIVVGAAQHIGVFVEVADQPDVKARPPARGQRIAQAADEERQHPFAPALHVDVQSELQQPLLLGQPQQQVHMSGQTRLHVLDPEVLHARNAFAQHRERAVQAFADGQVEHGEVHEINVGEVPRQPRQRVFRPMALVAQRAPPATVLGRDMNRHSRPHK